MEVCKPKLVNSYYILFGVNTLRVGGPILDYKKKLNSNPTEL